MENKQLSINKRNDLVQDFFENFDLKLFYYVAKKSMFFVAILLLFCFLIPYSFIRYSTPIFETKATLIKKKEISNAILDDKNTEFLKSNDEEKINRDIQVIKSDFLLDNIADSMLQNVLYFKKGRVPYMKFEIKNNTFFILNSDYKILENQIYNQELILDFNDKSSFDLFYKKNGETIKVKDIKSNKTFSNADLSINISVIDPKIEGKYILVINSKENIKNFVLSNLNVVNGVPNIFFSMKGANSQKSEYIISQVLKGFLTLDQKENSEKVENSIIYIKNYIDTLNAQLRVSQIQKTNYVKANSIYDPASQLHNNLSEIEAYHQKIDEIEAKLYSIQRLKNDFSSNNSSKIEIGTIGDDKELTSLIYERNKLLIDFKPSHPTVSIINKQIKERLNSVNNTLKLEVEDYQNRLGQIRTRRNEVQSSLSSLPEKDMEFGKIQKEVEIKEKYVIDLIEKQIQYLILKSSISSDYIVIQPPKTSTEQIYPRKSLLYSTGAVIFILFSFLLILVRYIKFDKIISIDVVKRNTHIPILGYIPFVEEAHDEKNSQKNSPESKIVVINNPKSRTSEVFKKMRASLKYTSKSDYKTIASTSTISGEGKTFVLINLAAVHALLDKKVIIIDLDLRKPRISKSFKLSNHLGMSNLLTDNSINLDDCIQTHSELANLDVITSGPIPPNPSELIISDKFTEILDELKKRYDYVFIDTPPIGLVNESIEIVNKVDIPLYLVKFNYSRKEFFNTMNETYALKPNLFLVINHYGDGASSYVNYSYGGYSYGYGYGGDYHKDKVAGYYTDSLKNKKLSLKDKLGKIFDWNL